MRWLSHFLIISVAGCATGDSENPPNAHRVLEETLRARYAASPGLQALGAAVSDSMKISTDTSRAVPGLTYHWGTYTPPNTADATVWAVAGQWEEQSLLLQSPSDWEALASLVSWAPTTSKQVIEACGEVIQTTGPRRALYPRPVIYRDSATLSRVLTDELPLLPESRDTIWSVARSPNASNSGSNWQASLWVLERGQTTLYHCEFFRRENRLRMSLRAVDSIPRVGLMTGAPRG